MTNSCCPRSLFERHVNPKTCRVRNDPRCVLSAQRMRHSKKWILNLITRLNV